MPTSHIGTRPRWRARRERENMGRRGRRREASALAEIDVRALRYLALVHLVALGELARRLVPPDRAALLLLGDDLGLARDHVADELRVLGNVMTGRQHAHGERRSVSGEPHSTRRASR